MQQLRELPKAALCEKKRALESEYESFKARGLKLNMARGKPSDDQLDLCNELLTNVNIDSGFTALDGMDCRNYGAPFGLPENIALFSELLGVSKTNVVIYGNSSLNIMFDYISMCITHGADGEPWAGKKVKFICPVPGYDRHFTVLEYYGIEMLTIPMLADGPDMDALEELIKDENIKGMFCVPKYSNPTGNTFSDDVVRRIAALKPAAKDFRIIWDNAYFVHDLEGEKDTLLNIFDECAKNGTEDMVIEVVSSSKITFAGAGISAVAASDKNIAAIKKRMSYQTICHDKLNQLRHSKMFPNAKAVYEQMRRHAKILTPKFEAVNAALEKRLSGLGIAEWTKPNGGYFVSLDVMDGCAKRVVELCQSAGVVLTGAGATFPYGKDPRDANIRIAPSYPPVEELNEAMKLLCICVELATVEKLLSE